jgi:cytochrome c oxidase assembly factor CtaG
MMLPLSLLLLMVKNAHGVGKSPLKLPLMLIFAAGAMMWFRRNQDHELADSKMAGAGFVLNGILCGAYR